MAKTVVDSNSDFDVVGITTTVKGGTIEEITFTGGPSIPSKCNCDQDWYVAAFQALVDHHQNVLGETGNNIIQLMEKVINGARGQNPVFVIKPKEQNKSHYTSSRVTVNLGNDTPQEYFVYKGQSGGDSWVFVKRYLDYINKLPAQTSRGKISMEITYDSSKNNSRKRGSGMKDKTQKDLADLISNGIHQIVLTGAPGTGKTYTAREVAKYFVGNTDKLEKRFEFVQFHPSYDYTDFVEGLRPVDDSGTMKFKRVDGIFMKFCRYVAWANNCANADKEKKYFFVIDEINRADLSKVFGELMFCLEGDKRGKPIKTQYANLTTHHIFDKDDTIRLDSWGWKQEGDNAEWKPETKDEFYYTCFDGGFYIPENVVIIGTMNDIDRSVESMDFALRRRFTWLAVDVTDDLLKKAFMNGEFFDDVKVIKDKIAESLAKRVVAFNTLLHNKEYGLNKDYDISQGQFGGIPKSKFEATMAELEKLEGKDESEQNNVKNDEANKCVRIIVEWVWDYRVKSLLREYLRGSVSDMETELEKLKTAWKDPKLPVKMNGEKQENAESESGELGKKEHE